jgi:deoxyribonuclease-4
MEIKEPLSTQSLRDCGKMLGEKESPCDQPCSTEGGAEPLIVGYHIGKGNGFHQSVPAAKAFLKTKGIDMTAAQIFVVGPQGGNVVIDDLDIKLLAKFVDEEKFNLVVHGAYIDVPWSTTAATAKRSIALIKRELKICAAIHAVGLNIHLTAAIDKAIVEVMKELLSDLAPLGLKKLGKKEITDGKAPATGGAVRVYLEIPARKPTRLTFETPERLTSLYVALTRAGLADKVGFTLDTAHIWSCGVDISTHALAKAYLDALPPAHYMIHLNDNFNPLGTHKDIHAPLGEGTMWKKEAAWQDFLGFAKKTGAIVILERSTTADSPTDNVALAEYMQH